MNCLAFTLKQVKALLIYVSPLFTLFTLFMMFPSTDFNILILFSLHTFHPAGHTQTQSWIGFEKSGSGYQWLDGSSGSSFNNWDSAAPKVDSCVQMTTDGTWTDVACDSFNSIICKREDSKLPVGWVQTTLGVPTYKIYCFHRPFAIAVSVKLK